MRSVTRLYIRVGGRVQGVGFRFFTQRKAQALGLVGYVRNRPDGAVEIEAEGLPDRVMALLDAVKQGPASAYVRRVTADPRDVKGIESSFDVI